MQHMIDGGKTALNLEGLWTGPAVAIKFIQRNSEEREYAGGKKSLQKHRVIKIHIYLHHEVAYFTV